MGKVRFGEVELSCDAFPASSLIGLAIAGFLAIMTETLPSRTLNKRSRIVLAEQ